MNVFPAICMRTVYSLEKRTNFVYLTSIKITAIHTCIHTDRESTYTENRHGINKCTNEKTICIITAVHEKNVGVLRFTFRTHSMCSQSLSLALPIYHFRFISFSLYFTALVLLLKFCSWQWHLHKNIV